jgi:hypothetical protein
MIFAAAALAAIATVAPSPAFAQGISIGPDGVRVETRRERDWERRRRRGAERREERCRTIIERRRDRFGDMVTRRTRVCR